VIHDFIHVILIVSYVFCHVLRVSGDGIRNILSQDYSFPGTFFPEPFVPWNIRSLDRSFPGTFGPENE